MKRLVTLLAILTVATVVVDGTLFWIFEHPHNPSVRNVRDVVWWWVVTSATVGYGDIVPVTWPGRVVSMVTIVAGFLIYTNFVAVIVQWAHGYLERRERGTAPVTARNHIVLCEYTAVADELVQSLPHCEGFRDREVVIVTDLVSRNPYPRHHFVYGVPISPAALRQANVPHAAYVFVFANLRFADPDVKTLHIASRVFKLNPGVTVFAELVNPASDLLEHVPGKLIAANSRALIRAVLQHDRLDPNDWLPQARGPAAA